MNFFIKISIKGSFPSGTDDFGTFQVTEEIHDEVVGIIMRGIVEGTVIPKELSAPSKVFDKYQELGDKGVVIIDDAARMRFKP